MYIRVPKPLSGYELRLELSTTAVIWALFGSEEAKEVGTVDITPEDLALAERVAQDVLAVIDEFKED